MTFWGYVVLLFIIGLMVEQYQFTKHELEMERIRESQNCAELRRQE